MSKSKNTRNKIISVIVMIIIAAMAVGIIVWCDYTRNDKKNIMKHLQEEDFIMRFPTIINSKPDTGETRTYYLGSGNTGKMLMRKTDNIYYLDLTCDGQNVYLEIGPVKQEADSGAITGEQNMEKLVYQVTYLTPETFVANMTKMRQSTSDLVLSYSTRTLTASSSAYADIDTEYKCYIAEDGLLQIAIVSDKLYDTSHADLFRLTVGGMVFQGSNTTYSCDAPATEVTMTVSDSNEMRAVAAQYGFDYDATFNENSEQDETSTGSS